MSSFQMNKIHSAEMIARQASRANSRVSQGIRQKSSFDSEASVASFESEANSRAGTTSTQANSHRVKADYVLCYFAKDIKSSTEPPEMPNKKDPSFVLNKQRLVFLENLANYGCEIEQVIGQNKEIMYVLIRTPFKILLDVAEKLRVKLPISENDLENYGEDTAYTNCLSRIIDKSMGSKFIEKNSRTYFTAPYTSDMHETFEKFFDHDDVELTLLPKDRIALTYEILSRTSFGVMSDDPFESFENFEADSKKGIQRLIADKTFLQAFPLHDSYDSNVPQFTNDREILAEYWASWKRFYYQQPLHIIRRYLGDKLGFYFTWLGYYTSMLFLPAFVGLFVVILSAATIGTDIPTNEKCDSMRMGNTTMCPLDTDCKDLKMENKSYCNVWKLADKCSLHKFSYFVDNPYTMIFSLFMIIWTVVFIDFWKRQQSVLQFQWDTVDFDQSDENVRPEYEQDVKKRKLNKITGKVEPYIDWWEKVLSYLLSWSIVLVMFMSVIISVFAIAIYRKALKLVLPYTQVNTYMASVTGAFISLIFILIVSKFYEYIAIKMTDWEHHKTDTDYENALTVKVWVFQFANFYGTIIYIAFAKGKSLFNSSLLSEECEPGLGSCMYDLWIQMLFIMVGKQFFNNFLEIYLPWCIMWYNRCRHKKKNLPSKQWEKDYLLLSWTDYTLFDEYLEMVIQFGFITLFVIAFPLGPLFALINNIFEIRIDAKNMLFDLKRPLSKRAQDIGIWLPILDLISKIAILFNGLIISFSSDFVPRVHYYFKYGNNTLNGYTDYILNESSFKNQTCYESSSLQSKEWSDEFLLSRLIFFIVFEHVMFLLVTALHYLIPNVPENISQQIQREKILSLRAIWDVKRKYKTSKSQPQQLPTL